MKDADCIRRLLSATAVRERAHEMLALCEAGALNRWSVDLARMAEVEAYVLSTTRETYPDLAIPFHSRWRHFELVGGDRVASFRADPNGRAAARGHAAFDLAIVSVLLDAGAGPSWRYRGAGRTSGRSEGLALATLDMFETGLFSATPKDPRRVDAARLEELSLDELRRGFQASDVNPLAGLEGRLELLRGLGTALRRRPDLFDAGDGLRPGALFDRLARRAQVDRLTAGVVLETLLDAFVEIWPGRLVVAGIPLGDTWRHPAIRRQDASDGLAPFHKLSQWMAYSLVEPLLWAGIEVSQLDELTGLPEYRNGGLFVDAGVLRPRDRADVGRSFSPGDETIVEWRALTVALLDRLAERMRRTLGRSAEDLPLARILQGGTWAAGRKIARSMRPDGSPPIAVLGDGTVF